MAHPYSLGHVALLTDLMATLAELRLQLETTIVVIFIANEENSTFVGIGVDQLAKEGHMDELKGGPLFWIDSADSQPCIGTAGIERLVWLFSQSCVAYTPVLSLRKYSVETRCLWKAFSFRAAPQRFFIGCVLSHFVVSLVTAFTIQESIPSRWRWMF